jgi:hypothetical protein
LQRLLGRGVTDEAEEKLIGHRELIGGIHKPVSGTLNDRGSLLRRKSRVQDQDQRFSAGNGEKNKAEAGNLTALIGP